MMTRLFEKTAEGLLVEVHPERAEEERKGRRFTRLVACEVDVLFTAEEEAAFDAEEVAQAEQEQRAEAEGVEADTRRAIAIAKLAALGLTLEDIEAIRAAK